MSKFKFDRVLKNIERMKNDVPKVLANDALKFFNSSWPNQGFTDQSLVGWQARAKETKKTKGKLILVSSGKLRRAVATSKREVSFNKIRFAVENVPYAGYINEGTEKMPQRKFMGDSEVLKVKLKEKLITVTNKIWQV